MNHEPETHDYLTRTEWVVTQKKSPAGAVVRAVLLLGLAAALGLGVRYYDHSILDVQALSTLRGERENLTRSVETLREAVAEAHLDVELERATRAELERQLAASAEELKQVREELDFLKAARTNGGATAR